MPADLCPGASAAAGDPSKGFWTYADLAAVFGLSAGCLKRRMLRWCAEDGFPAPLPWSAKEKRWHPAAVLAWKDRTERAARAHGLLLVQGGRRG